MNHLNDGSNVKHMATHGNVRCEKCLKHETLSIEMKPNRKKNVPNIDVYPTYLLGPSLGPM